MVTRAEEPDGPLGRLLAAEGARVLHQPTVTIGPPDDPASLRRGLGRLDDFDWLVLTSPRAAEAVTGLQLPEDLAVAVVGPSTAHRARSSGLPVDLVGSGEGAEALGREMVARGIGPGARVFFPASSRAGNGLVEILEAAGATVEKVVAYETHPVTFDVGGHREVMEADAVTFTSPSAVEGWVSSWSATGVSFEPGPARYVAIGETTAAALEAHRMPAVVAPEPSFAGIVDAIRRLTVQHRD